MKKKPAPANAFRLAPLCLLLLVTACKGKSRYEAYSPSPVNLTESHTGIDLAKPEATKPVRFNGPFVGEANEQSFTLNLTNEGGNVKGAMAESGKGYTLSGAVAGETLTGSINWGGEIPFTASYYGANLVMQLDKDIVALMKAAALAKASEDNDGEAFAKALLIQDKIIFLPQ